MQIKKKIPCILIARKNSKGIKNKNRIIINGVTLIQHSINYLKKCKFVDDIVVSTDDEKIEKIAEKNDCFAIFPRPKKLSTDFATTEAVLKHALNIYENKFGITEITAFIQLTEYFKPKKILDQCILALIKNKNIDSCFAGYEQHKNFWIKKNQYLKRISPFKDRYKPRQLKNPIYREDTGLGLATRSIFIRNGERVGKKTICISYNNPLFSLDLNNKTDLVLINKLAKYFS
jgi:N-acylneuraminate cytidylyltransferase